MAPCSPERSAQRAPATKPLPALQRGPPPHSPPAACPQPRPHAQSPQPVPPQDGAAELPRSRQAQCESRAASPAHPRARESPTPRPNASAQYPRCGTSGFPQDQTGPQQTAPPSAPHDPDSPAQAPPQICTAPPLPPRVPDRPANGNYIRAIVPTKPTGDVDSRFGRAIQVFELNAGQELRYSISHFF